MNIVPLQLPVLSSKPSTPATTHQKFYIKTGFLTSLNSNDEEIDVVLERPLDGLAAGVATPILSTDTVKIAFEKINATFSSIVLSGVVVGTASFKTGPNRLEIETAIDPVYLSTQLFYTHHQLAASTIWTINHNLGRYPVFCAVDTTNEVIEGYQTYIDENTVQIEFSASISGRAFI